jgi:regulator of extracellular matrix RemA (YlzA/DUF370 family)
MTIKSTLKLSLIATAILTTANAASEIDGDDLPPAKPGQCFTKAFFPAKYTTVTERVLSSEASEKMRVIPAKYGWKTEKIKVSDGTEKTITIPATYKTVYVKMLEKEESTKLVPIPARYKTVTKKVLASEPTERLIKQPAQYKRVPQKIQIEAARTEWKKTKCEDRGCNQSEVVCLVEIPAKYKTVMKRVVAKPITTKKVVTPAKYKTVNIQQLVSPAGTKTIVVPATYKQVPKRVVDRPASSKVVKTPPKYKTIKTKIMLEPSKTTKNVIPATYKTVTKKKKVAEGYAKWVPIVCKSSMTRTTIRKVQEALKAEGFYNGTIDSVWGASSRAATRAYQKAKGLPVAGLSVATMQSLGIY